MHELYQVLGVRSGASDAEVKAAFRSLAKQLHPDLRPGDAAAEQRLRDVIRAYETLIDPPSRAAYDAGLERQRRSSRWRFRSKAATMLTAFTLTVSTGLFWRQLGEALLPAGDYAPRVSASETPAAAPGRSETASAHYGIPARADTALHKSPEGDTEPTSALVAAVSTPANELVTGSPLQPEIIKALPPPLPDPPSAGVGPQRHDAASLAPGSVPPVQGKIHSWASYRNAAFGFTLQYPADVFLSGPVRPGGGHSFISRDGRARLVVSADVNASGVTPAKHRQSLMEGPYRGAVLDYAPQRSTWYVLSGTMGTEMFYQRVTFSCDGQTFHAWRLVYPVSERTFYDRIVEEVHRRYRRGGGDERRCG